MKKISKKVIVATGILAGVAAAFMPLRTYATIKIDTTESSTTYSLTVNPVITLDVAVLTNPDPGSGNGVLLRVAPNLIATGRFQTTVSSNHIYTLSLSAYCTPAHKTAGFANPSQCTDMIRDDSGSAVIPTLTAGNDLVQGTTAWGIKKAIDSNYSPVPGALQTMYTSSAPTTGDVTEFDVGVAVGATLAQGTYNGAIVVTAATTGATTGP